MIRRLYHGILNRLTSVKKSIGKWYFTKVLKAPHYVQIKNGQLFANWIFQRLFGINGDVPYSVSYTSKIMGSRNIIFHGDPQAMLKSFAVSGGCFFTVFRGTTLEIGENTIWSFNVCIQTGNHDLRDRSAYRTGSVKIGRNCWLGTSVTILAGVELGDNVTVGANSVVTKSFPSNSVIGGCPARIIKTVE